MLLSLYDSLTRQTRPFKPLHRGRVGMYTCGPTVYNYAHLGNLRTYIFEDLLKRVLIYNGYRVKHVMNITDVGHLTSDADEGEDKVEKSSRREGKTAWEIAEFYTKAFRNDLRDLNIRFDPEKNKDDKFPAATEHIPEQIALIKKLERNGFTYRTSDGVYFDTAKFPEYGRLANLEHQSLKAGARVALGEKKHPHDFALWKFSPVGEKRQMEWDSPWGKGFPGWHIECSAMAEKFLGRPFDIHCGGIDHIPVHHTNEIAQSEAAYGKPLADYWMHGEFLIIPAGDSEIIKSLGKISRSDPVKMAKSGNNFITLKTVKDRGISPLAFRYLCLQTHYRKPLTFSWDALAAAQQGLNHLYFEANRHLPKGYSNKQIAQHIRNSSMGLIRFNEIKEIINDDLNTPELLAYVWERLRSLDDPATKTAVLYHADEILGLDISKLQSPISKRIEKQDQDETLRNMLSRRDSARTVKDWATSDILRKQLEEMGYEVTDTIEGTKINKK